MNAKEVLDFAKKKEAKQLDLRFSDIPGLQHHVSYPISELSEESFADGFGMDGSSIRGWAAINESDMLLIPDPTTAFMDPFYEIPTLVMVCDVIDPDHAPELQPRPALDRAQSRAVPEKLRHRRHGILRRRGRVLHLRQRALRSEPALRLLLHRRRRGPLELGPRGRQPGLPAALQGRLFPGSSHRSLPGAARPDGRDHARSAGSTSSAITTKWPPAASARSTSATTRCSSRPTT